MYYGKLPLLYSKQLVRNYKYIHKYTFKILETCDMSVSKEKSKYVSFNIYFYIELFFLRDLIKSKMDDTIDPLNVNKIKDTVIPVEIGSMSIKITLIM